MVDSGTVIHAVQLRPGDMFETLVTRAAGTCRDRELGMGAGIPVELWYSDGTEVVKMLAPQIRVRFLAASREAA